MTRISIQMAALSLALAASAGIHAEGVDTLRQVSLREVSVIASPKGDGVLRRQPASVSVVEGSDIDGVHPASLKGVSAQVPNLFIPDFGSRQTSAIYIRGIGSRINSPAVGLYVDNIPYSDKASFDFNLADIERIEVLRGPQATLYGRNTMGGLVKAYTRSPLTYSGTDVHLGFASGDNHRTATLTHYQHPTDKFAWYVGGYYEGGDGFFSNDATGEKVDDMLSAGGRLRALWLPTERLKFDLSVNYDHSSEGAYPYYYMGTVNPAGEQYADLVGRITSNRESSYRRNMVNVGLNTQWECDRFTLSNVTGYQGLHDRMFMDQDFLKADIFTIEQKQRVNAFSNELTMKSKRSGRWNWVTGANVMYKSLKTTGPVTFWSDGVEFLEKNINGNMPAISMPGMPMPITMNVNIADEQMTMGGAFDTPILNAALFHQSTMRMTDRLSLTLGLRLDYEHTAIDYNAPGEMNYDFKMSKMPMPLHFTAAPLFDGTLSDDYLQLMPRLAVQYDLGRHGNLYATVSRGTRSGGYNVQMFSDLLQGDLQNQIIAQIKEKIPGSMAAMASKFMPEPVAFDVENSVTFKPEYSWNYEAGAHLSTADNRWQADVAVFFLDTRDQQIARFANSGLGRMIVNAGHSQSRGAEVSMRGRLTEGLAVGLNYGYTYAIFTDYDNSGSAGYNGNYVPFVPKHTASLDASYTWRFARSWAKSLTVGATYMGAGRIYWTESNDASQRYYDTVAARVSLQAGSVGIELWGRNLTDTDYHTLYIESMGRGFAQKCKPAQAGIDLRWHF